MRTILVVDDELSVVETLSEVLAWEGYAVLTASNGQQALEQLAKERPVLVLADYMMPIMDGVQMVEAMSQQDAYRDIPVIMMTAAPLALAKKGDQKWKLVLRKPFDAATLLKAVNRVLNGAT
jgi:two-component system, OmpR family, alkaline phosphatase synthesis response regulator PhoP